MSRATELCKMLEKLIGKKGKKNEAVEVNSNDNELFDIEISSSSLSDFYSELKALIPTLEYAPAQKVKPMLVSLSKFIEGAMAARQHYPLEDIECNLYIESETGSEATFTFSGIGTFWFDEDDTYESEEEKDELRQESFSQALEALRHWDRYMGKYSKHIVDCIKDYDLYNDRSFSFEVYGSIR